jgi:phospholipase/carboxylesterase
MDETILREIETGPNPTAAVIWLHGLGADGSDFVPIVPELGLPDDAAVRFIFPDAPYRAVTCNGGYEMRAWYDILSLAPESRRIDEAGLLESRDAVRALIARETGRGIPASRIFLAGFSQGGAVAYLTALTHPEPLAGLLALSTYVPSADLLQAGFNPACRTLPVFAAHGSVDDVVSMNLGRQALDLLQSLGVQPAWHAYEMGHGVCLAEVQDIGDWLAGRLGEIGAS